MADRIAAETADARAEEHAGSRLVLAALEEASTAGWKALQHATAALQTSVDSRLGTHRSAAHLVNDLLGALEAVEAAYASAGHYSAEADPAAHQPREPAP